ncbi:YHS domain-containing protein [Arcticibacter eurypsychrophilus]|uniref:YHS domain-containing protein n=1 Tax=Arcticibacter eurypsychrophilus TaxID=1434752 RepID=UPI00084D307E|nr:YHS domain-containing protein [Arcticibacter eurypsychrophilus]
MKNYSLLFLMICGLAGTSLQVKASHGNHPFLKGRVVVNTSLLDTLKADSKDPICGMPVKKGSTLTVSYQDKVYGFCGKSCKASFSKQPEKYVKSKAKK